MFLKKEDYFTFQKGLLKSERKKVDLCIQFWHILVTVDFKYKEAILGEH